jgi:hypothetical protein
MPAKVEAGERKSLACGRRAIGARARHTLALVPRVISTGAAGVENVVEAE